MQLVWNLKLRLCYQVKVLARRLPELINLLQLQDVFPSASVAALVEGSLGAGNGKVSQLSLIKPLATRSS